MKSALLFLFASACAHAQVASASLSGVVRDPSEAVVPNAAIVLTRASTTIERLTRSDSRGAYLFENVAPGAYTLTVQVQGFQPGRAELTLEVNQRARHDLRLQLGGAESIDVVAAISPLETESASAGDRMDNPKIQQLPLASRNVISLVTLGPGAIPRQLGGFVHDVNNDMQEGTRGSVALNPPINGARSTHNTFLLDGAYDTDRNTFAIAVYPPIDSVQEFHIQSSLASAEFPQSGGGAIDVVTKSGTRNLHGSAFEYLRNEFTDARNYFDDPALPRPIHRQNQFGGSLGGPVAPLRNTFFYGVYDGVRQKTGSSALSIVPDAPVRAGDFSGQSTIFDPLTAVPRAPFPGNRIPQNRIDSVATEYLTRYEPLPNSFGGSSNYRDATPSQLDTNVV